MTLKSPRLAAALERLGFKALTDFEAWDEGEGPYLKHWFSAEPQPDQAAIDAAVADLEANPPPQPKSVHERLAELEAMKAVLIEEDPSRVAKIAGKLATK